MFVCLAFCPALGRAAEPTKSTGPLPASAKPQDKSPSNKKASPQESRKPTAALGLGLGVVLPPVRPTVSLSYSILNAWGEVAMRVTGSYLSLAQTFKNAAVESQYANKLSDTKAHLWDVGLQAPDVEWHLPLNLYAALSPEVRMTSCRADYTTVANETLVFSGWGVGAGVNASGGLRIQPKGTSFSFEINASYNWPFASFGQADLSFENATSSGGQTFSNQDLDSMLNSLQPYVQKLTVQPTAGLQLRAGWRF